MDETLYVIVQGVHRCVAARLVGLPAIFAEVHDGEGHSIRSQLVPLGCVYSPKSEIDRWDRGWDFRKLVSLLRTAQGRASLPPVILHEMPTGRAKFFTLVFDVVITGLDEGEV